MVEGKFYKTATIIAIIAAVILCFAMILYSSKTEETPEAKKVSMDYEDKLFNTDQIITIDIQMEADDWTEMLQDAISEEYKMCDVVINGEKFRKVAIRPKGNTSLFAIAMDPTTDRYSLKFEFDHFMDGQTCYGLDKLILNNSFFDATNMKEAVAFDMYQYIGADASLYNFASVSVNGEYIGLFTALEGVEESFMTRNYGTLAGELYKPESNNMEEVMEQLEGDLPSAPPEEIDPETVEKLGADLNYTDYDLDSYENIWIGEINRTSRADRRRVVKALKNMSEGTQIEESINVDNVLKYMAVHTFVVNMDGLSGMMGHNYYLYEYDGALNIIPWDYNLAFGGMSMGENYGADDVVNYPIDTPFQGTRFFDALLSNDEYLAKYHEYLQQIVDGYVNGGAFDKFYNRTRSQIDTLVETDPTAFYTYEEYLDAADTLYDLIKLRAESVDGQISGTVPSTIAGQVESDALIDASHIDLATSGQFDMEGDQAMLQNMQSDQAPPEGQQGMQGPPPEQQGMQGPPTAMQGNMIDSATGLPIMLLAMIRDLALMVGYFVLVLILIYIIKRVSRR